MLLCLDIGNTHLFGGVFHNNQLILRFRHATHLIGTSDQFGMFLVQLLSFNKINSTDIKAIAACSVVPGCDYTIQHTMKRYFQEAHYFVLKPGVKTGLNITIKKVAELGADRIANAIGAIAAFPNQPLIVIDMGTATTVCAINKKRDYLGGIILPGVRLGMESLKTNTAKLTEVNIEEPANYLGRTTRESIQSGLYYGTLGALREMIAGLKQEVFQGAPLTIIGTGGFAHLYHAKQLFNEIMPDLVLHGLLEAHKMNHDF